MLAMSVAWSWSLLFVTFSLSCYSLFAFYFSGWTLKLVDICDTTRSGALQWMEQSWIWHEKGALSGVEQLSIRSSRRLQLRILLRGDRK